MGREKLLIGVLVILLAIVKSQAYHDDYNPGTTVVCKDKSTPCSCYPDKLLLDCHFDSKTQSYSQRLRDALIRTPKTDFHPLKVDLSGNLLQSFDDSQLLESEQRKTIEILDLSNNQLEITSQFAFDSFENLKVLNLSNNRIQLYPSYSNYRNRYEYNRGSPYEWLSEKLGRTLEVLDLSHNRVDKLPGHLLSQFTNLKKLILDGNSIIDFWVDEIHLPKLEELSIQGCSINNMYGKFYNSFPNLKKLLMRNNKMYQFPQLYNVPHLKYVDLTGSQITGFYKQNNELYSIETLLFGENMLYSIGYKAFTVFPNLTKLDLHESRFLRSIDKTAFRGYYFDDQKVKLQELDLSECALERLDEELLPWKQLKSLKIKGNNFQCDTRLAWLINDRTLPVEKGVDQPKCSEPEALQGRNFVDVKPEEINNPTETAALYYAKKALDILTQNQQIFFFGLGALCAALLAIFLKCCCCCVRCLFFVPMKKHFIKMESRLDRHRLMEHQSGVTEYKQQEDTQTIAESIPDEE